jgi:hypothetical protein
MCGIVGVVNNAPVNQLIYDALLLLGLTLVVVSLGIQAQPVWAASETALLLTEALQALKPLLPGPLAEYIP